MYKKIKFSASAMCFDWLNVKTQLKEIEDLDLDYLHIDIIDGNFIPDFTMGSSIINSIRSGTNMKFYYHLMVDEPRRIFDSLNIKKKDILAIHQEASKNLHSDLVEIRNIGAEVGIVLSPGTPLDSLEYVIEDADNIILMTVNPGYKGQTLVPQTLNKIEKLDKMLKSMNLRNKITISVDGNVNPTTIPEMIKKGADNLILGSSGLFDKNNSIKKNFEKIIKAIDSVK
tara:strand:+ start:528 stop:1211 length:684 start_codon:yes stop_codon:yes gene_type:complete